MGLLSGSHEHRIECQTDLKYDRRGKCRQDLHALYEADICQRLPPSAKTATQI